MFKESLSIDAWINVLANGFQFVIEYFPVCSGPDLEQRDRAAIIIERLPIVLVYSCIEEYIIRLDDRTLQVL